MSKKVHARRKYYLVIVRASGRQVWSNWSYYPHTDEDAEWFMRTYGRAGDTLMQIDEECA